MEPTPTSNESSAPNPPVPVAPPADTTSTQPPASATTPSEHTTPPTAAPASMPPAPQPANSHPPGAMPIPTIGRSSIGDAAAPVASPDVKTVPSPVVRKAPERVSLSDMAAAMATESDASIDRQVEQAMAGVSADTFASDAVKAPTADEPVPGQVVNGRIANVGREDMLIDFGAKDLGTMSLAEGDPGETYKVGDKIDVQIVGREERSGLLQVSRKKAKQALIWESLAPGLVVDCEVTGMNKGGLEVSVEGLRGFIPASHVELHFVKDISPLLGQRIRAEVTKFDRDDENIVLSRRKVLQREAEENKSKMLGELEVGQVRRGKVRNVAEFGAFIDLGGIDGLLHISDMSWGRVEKPEDVVKIGDEIDVKVLKIDAKRDRISLGLKQALKNPWDDVADRYAQGGKVKGRVMRLENFGAFVEIEPGLEALLPISEMSWTQRLRHPSEVVKEGDVIDASILKIEQGKKRMALSLKALKEDPWAGVDSKFPEGSKIKGKVVRTTDFGAFVELEEGVDGLIHISELSEERIRSVTDKVKVGQEVEVRVLGVDPESKRVSLSLKAPPREPTPEEIAKIEAERAAIEKRRESRKGLRGGITVGWDDGGGLSGLDPSKFKS